MLDFRTQRQAQTLLDESDFILEESAIENRGPLRWIETHELSVVQRIGRDVVADTPNDVVTSAELEMMLKIRVECVSLLCINHSLAILVVVIELQREVGTVGKIMRPTSENVSADCFDVI